LCRCLFHGAFGSFAILLHHVFRNQEIMSNSDQDTISDFIPAVFHTNLLCTPARYDTLDAEVQEQLRAAREQAKVWETLKSGIADGYNGGKTRIQPIRKVNVTGEQAFQQVQQALRSPISKGLVSVVLWSRLLDPCGTK
jgi:hypothetical protein